jgi:hypothetical protein
MGVRCASHECVVDPTRCRYWNSATNSPGTNTAALGNLDYVSDWRATFRRWQLSQKQQQ